MQYMSSDSHITHLSYFVNGKKQQALLIHLQKTLFLLQRAAAWSDRGEKYFLRSL